MSYFDTFFAEKEIPFALWEIQAPSGDVHLIDSETIVAVVKATSGKEAEQVRDVLVRLDFANAPILPFLHHLAVGYVLNLEAAS